MTTIDHTCIHVLDLDRSAAFYRDALGLTPVRSLDMPDFQLELCRETKRIEPYHLGDDTPHLALRAQDFDALKAKHRALGLIFDELNGGIYFIKDPDGHILEILPPKQ